MPNWNFPHDLYNTTFDRVQFNPFGLSHITEEVYKQYVPYQRCLKCDAWSEKAQPKPTCFETDICNLRPKDYKAGFRHIVTRGMGRPPSLMILVGTLVWNYEHKLRFIFRACAENKIEMHHINANSWDNRYKNLVMIDRHSILHGRLKSLSTSIKKLTIISENTKYDREIRTEIKRLERVYEKECYGVTDSPRVFQIIEVVNAVIDGNLTSRQGQTDLEKLEAAFPVTVISNKEQYDFRKLRNRHQHIKNYNQRGANAI